jgi:hypothetical protein
VCAGVCRQARNPNVEIRNAGLTTVHAEARGEDVVIMGPTLFTTVQALVLKPQPNRIAQNRLPTSPQ